MTMGLSGHFDLDSTSSLFKLRINWSEQYNASTNSSVVTISSVQFKSTGWYGFTYYPDGMIRVNGETAVKMDSSSGTHNCTAANLNEWTTVYQSDGSVARGSVTVAHDENGAKNVSIDVTGNRFLKCYFYTVDGETGGSGWGCAGSNVINLTTIPTYMLSVDVGDGSEIVVSRTSSGYAATGRVAHGSRLYYGDSLKITFAPKENYRLTQTSVNNKSFNTGNTHTVTGDVSIVSIAQVLASSIGATNADIGSVSTITITKYNSGYYHSLQYNFEGATGYITSSGGVQQSETRFRNTSVPFLVPELFYSKIPDSKSGVCTIICRTYADASSEVVLGVETQCTFVVYAPYDNCAPILQATIEDTNSVTKALTGNASYLVRYKSTAVCSVIATSKNESTIAAMSIDGHPISIDGTESYVTATKSFANVDKNSFVFAAEDSRGYEAHIKSSPTMIAYVALTCNPEIMRPTPTGKEMTMSFSGNVYRGSFGKYSNTLSIQYRCRPEGGVYGEWHGIDQSYIVFGASTYRSKSPILLEEEFEYDKSYEFEIMAQDGAQGYILSAVTTAVIVRRGVPVFDWGENDFNVNGELRINNVPLSSHIQDAISKTELTEEQLVRVAQDTAYLIKQRIPYEEDIEITEDGATYENYNFKGNVTIKADHVSIKNCLFDGYDIAIENNKEKKVYKTLTIDGDYASLADCVIYAVVYIGKKEGTTLTGNESTAINCNFFNHVAVNGEHVQLKNVSFGSNSYDNPLYCSPSANGYAGALQVNESATDLIVSDFTVACVTGTGIYFQSYGGIFSNFTIRGCSRTGIRLLSGSCQVENGKIFFCGPYSNPAVADVWTGGLLAKANYENGMMKYIPELNIQNVSIQQNFGYGIWLEKVINSNINVSLMANCSDRFPSAAKEPYVNEHGVFMKPKDKAYSKYLHYGMYLKDCKNVSGIVNGISCHTHWNGADKGYYDDVPTLNSINVTWEPCYSNDDKNHGHWKNPRLFAYFLPEVHAEIVNGLRIGNQFTEADCVNPVTYQKIEDLKLDYEKIKEPDEYGYYQESAESRLVIPVESKVPITGKGTVRLYVEAPNLNIYPCVYIKDANGNILYEEVKELGTQLNNIMARGMHNVYSGTFCYDFGDVSNLPKDARFELCIHFNKIDSTLEGNVTPKIRAQFYPY